MSFTASGCAFSSIIRILAENEMTAEESRFYGNIMGIGMGCAAGYVVGSMVSDDLGLLSDVDHNVVHE